MSPSSSAAPESIRRVGLAVSGVVLLGLLVAPVAAQVVLNEVVYAPASMGRLDENMLATRVELYNASGTDVTLGGWMLSTRDALSPVLLPDLDLPSECFLTVYFCAGTDDVDFADGAGAYYYGSAALEFDQMQDECALYAGAPDASTMVDFVAWDTTGAYAPGSAHDYAAAAGIWTAGTFVDTQNLDDGDSLARYFDGFDHDIADDWRIVPLTLYVHHGAYTVENPIQLSPDNRAVFTAAPTLFEWTEVIGATGYDFQIATDYTFTDLVVDVTDLTDAEYELLGGLSNNVYFWRVRASFGADETPWAAEWMFVVNSDLVALEAKFCRSCPFKFQHKDTRLLCLWDDRQRGSLTGPPVRPGCPETGPCAWDIPHPDQSPDDSGCLHGRNYCWAASIAMVNGKYGGDLSQDRIAYENWHNQRPEPEGDLGHDRPNSDPQITTTLSWALNGAAISYQYVGAGNFTFAQMKQWIDERDCFVAAVPGHCLVPNFYFEFTTPTGTDVQIVYANDPWFGPYHPHVFSYVIAGSPTPYWRRHRENVFDAVWLQPTTGVTARMQEASVNTDSDNDGIMDFDEDIRALESSMNDPDTDKDEVPDKNDIRNYTFHDSYHRGHDNDDLWFSDFDFDGHRSENDCDSDNDGDFDGGEDINGNGRNPEAGETCMFMPFREVIGVHVDKDVYLVGEPVYIVDNDARLTRTYHAYSDYWYEYGGGCPTYSDGQALGHTGQFATNYLGGAYTTLVDFCPAVGEYHVTVDVLSDSLYSTPDNWDPDDCWVCKVGYRPVPDYPTPMTPIYSGCPSAPVRVATPGAYDPDGDITRWVWIINGDVWYDGDYPEIWFTFPPGYTNITVVFYDDDELSDSASDGFYVYGGMMFPVEIPMGEQINLHDATDQRYDTITVEEPASFEFVDDGYDAFSRVYPGDSDYWVGPVVDITMACYEPVSVYLWPFMSMYFTARYYVDPSVAEYGLPTVYAAVRDIDGNQAELGAVFEPDPELMPAEWTTVEVSLMSYINADEGFNPEFIKEVLFYGQGLYLEDGEPGLEWFDVLEVEIATGSYEIPGDCNDDYMIDAVDWQVVQGCMAGPGWEVSGECDCADMDGDTDADLRDMFEFQLEFGYIIPPKE